MQAYITLLSTENYLPGVRALHEALRRTGTRHPFVVAIASHIARHIDSVLESAGMCVRRIPETTAIPQHMIEGNGHWGRTFDKIQLFGLVEFSKLVYVDADMLVLANLDELFDKPNMSAVPAGKLIHPDWLRLNGGLMVIEPAAGLVDAIFALLPQALEQATAKGMDKIGDQDLLNAYLPNWSEMPGVELDQGYNIFQWDLDEHIDKHGYRLPHHPAHLQGRSDQPTKMIKIVHFIGPRKPWMDGAVIRQHWRALKKGRAGRWENQVFNEYRKLIDQMWSVSKNILSDLNQGPGTGNPQRE